jgi:hypothetical protein
MSTEHSYLTRVKVVAAARNLSRGEAMSFVEREDGGPELRAAFLRDTEAEKLREEGVASVRERFGLDDLEAAVHAFRVSPALQEQFGACVNYVAYCRAVRRGQNRAAEDPRVAASITALHKQERGWEAQYAASPALQGRCATLSDYLAAKRAEVAATRAAARSSAAQPASDATHTPPAPVRCRAEKEHLFCSSLRCSERGGSQCSGSC